MKNYGNTSDSKDIQTLESVKELIKQSDWNQNDETQLDYIKNRICNKEYVEPQTVAIIDTEIISTSGTYVLKGASIINNSWYYGIILPKGVKKEYGVEKTIELSNGTETYEIKYTLQPKNANSLVCPDGFQGGGAWYDKGNSNLPEALRNYDFVISFSCSNAYDGFTVKQYETTSSEIANKIDVEYNSEGLGGIKEVEPDVLLDADLPGGNFDWPENKKLNEGDVCLISYDAPWSSDPNKYQITGKGVAYVEGGIIKICLEGYSYSSYLAYNIYPNPSTTGYLSSWSGNYKVIKIGELTKIDDNLVNIPRQVQADWSQTDSNASDYIKNKPTIPTNVLNGSKNGSVRTSGANATLGTYAFAEGSGSIASGYISHAEGQNTTASGNQAHAEGYQTIASGGVAHAEGSGTTASGNTSHAEGAGTKAIGGQSHAEGNYTTANHKSQHVFGEYNIPDNSSAGVTARGNYVEIVGNGTGYGAESNARTLDWSGNEVLLGTLQLGGTSGVIIKSDNGKLYKSSDGGSTWKVISQEQVQADWNQNDSTQPDYIKNRTHYINKDCEAIDSYSVVEFPSYWKEPPESIYQENAYYRISFNWYNYLESKQEYYSDIFQLTRKYSSDQTIVHPYLCCGNMGLNYSGFPDTGEPFNFCAEINTDVDDRLDVRRIRIDRVNYPDPTNVLIERIDPFVKLDENFIPDTISKKINIPNLTISARGVEYKLSDVISALIDANILNN